MTNDYKLPLTSTNITAELLEKLRTMVPQIFTEGGVDFDKLKATLGETIVPKDERYGLNWAGKSSAFRHVQTPSVGTLLPQPELSVNFDTSENLIIEGDNLEVLKLLQKSYHNQIKLIYIDPPYNTGNEFIYPDNFHEGLDDYLKYTGQLNAEGQAQSSNRDTNGRFHSNWLNMMYPRLFLARNLLRDNGVIFVSIDDNEVHNLRMLMNEVFGEESFVAQFPWRKRTAKSDVPFGISQDFEWIMCYGKTDLLVGIAHERKYYQTKDYPDDRWRLSDLTTQRSADERPNSAFDMIDPKTGKQYPFNPKRTWGISKDTFQEYYDKGKIVFPDDYDFLNITIPAYRVFESEDKAKAHKKYGSEQSMKAISTLLPKEVGMSENGNDDMVSLFGFKIFSFPKPVSLVKYLLTIANDDQAIVLDFFAGSGTTAHAVLDLNQQDGGKRKFILVQLPEPLTSPLSASAGTPSTTPSLRATPSKEGEYKVEWGGSEATHSADTPPAILPLMHTIADITRERVRRVIKKLTDTAENSNSITDKHAPSLLPPPAGECWGGGDGSHLGFKAFKLASSNFKIWNADTTPTEGEAIAEQLRLYADNVTRERTQQDILYELLLKAGLPLSASVEQIEVAGKPVYAGSHGALLLCLENDINQAVLRGMMALKPQQILCLDSAFGGNDPLKTNTVLEANSHKITFKTV